MIKDEFRQDRRTPDGLRVCGALASGPSQGPARRSVRGAVYALILAVSLTTSIQADETSLDDILERLKALEKEQAEQREALQQRDERIAELEAELDAIRNSPAPADPEPQGVPAADPPSEWVEETPSGEDPVAPVAVTAERQPELNVYDEPEYFGEFQPGGRGFRLANTAYGDVNFSMYTYGRYINQSGFDETYTDYFGRTFDVNTRQDFQLNKVTLYLKGWIGSPKLRYLGYIWTANTSQGLGAQVVVAGNLTYLHSEAFNIGFGISGLPTTRSTEGNWPNWLRVDNRTIADEFFRGSFTTGLFGFGNLGDNWRWQAMLGNNLSQLGVDAGQLDDSLDTFSAALVWTPTGEYFNGFGDFEQSDSLRTRLGIHYTHSTEDRQSQPNSEDPENSQIRLSDGTPLFRPGAFATEGRVNSARYQMVSLDGGLKYNGWALEGEYYWRWVDEFVTEGDVPVDELYDHGFQLQASAMLIPKTWQIYLSGSKIFGEYGDPWDTALGTSWFPFESRQFRLNAEFIYLKNSPVGYTSVPYLVGANGTVFYANAEMRF